MKFSFNKNLILPFIISFILTYLLFPSNLHNYLNPMDYGDGVLWKTLDPSWNLTLNYINIKELTWGKDFVFTFGPLGYLSTKFLWGVNKYSVLFFDLFVCLNFFILFSKLLIKSKNIILSYILIILITIILPGYFGSSIALILFAFLIFWIIESLTKLYYLNYFFQTIIVILLFFIKINTGIIAVLFFLIGIFYNLFNFRKNMFKYIIIAIFPFISIYFLSLVFKIDLYNYLFYSLELIKGHNDLQYLDIIENRKYFYLVLPLLVSLLILFYLELKNNLTKNDRIKTIVIFFNLGALWFIVYKQAFVRADIYHIVEYFITSNLILGFLYFLFYDKYRKLVMTTLIIVLSINLYLVKTQTNQFNLFAEKISKTNYINSFREYNKLSGLRIFPNNNQLPLKIKEIVNTNSIDVYPWNSYMLLENNLNFTPRPVFQSYVTYTKSLQKLNFNFYNGKNAPKYVIYDTGATDERYSFHDDARLNLIFTKKYQVKDTFNYKRRNLLLLEKKENTKELKFVKIKEYAMMVGDPIVPQKDIFYEIELYQNLYGKINTFFFHAPPIKLEIKTQGGVINSHRTSNELLKSGLFSDYYISDTNDFKLLLDIGSNSKKIFTYTVDIQKKWMFNDKIRIKEYKISN